MVNIQVDLDDKLNIKVKQYMLDNNIKNKEKAILIILKDTLMKYV